MNLKTDNIAFGLNVMHLNDPEDIDNIQSAEKAVCEIGLESLIDRQFVKRLKDVRLLGTMKYIVPLDHNYSRYEHSLAVARLTLLAVQVLGLSNLASKVAVIAALLHDVGHTAMSHGAEVFLLKRQGRFHEGHTQRILIRLAKELESTGQGDLSALVQLAGDLLSGVLPSTHNHRFYNSHYVLKDNEIPILNALSTGPMSVDMIEGVTRTARSIGLKYPNPVKLISALGRTNLELAISIEAWPLVWQLFELERKIYEEYIYSEAGLAAEAMLTRALDLTFPKVTQYTGVIEINEYNYKLINDFLTWSDSPVIAQIQKNAAANSLLQKLENKDLFVSLARISPKTHSNIIESLEQNYDINAEQQKASIEDSLAAFLGIDPNHVILHSTIRKIFRYKGPETIRLFTQNEPFSRIKARTYSEIRQQFGTKRTSRNVKNIYLPNINAETLLSFSLPRFRPAKQPQAISVISKRFSQHEEEKNGLVATPQEVVDTLVSWAVRSPDDTILDPACGDGSFLHSAWNRLVSLGTSRDGLNQIIGVERQIGLWQEMKDLWRERVIREDFFEIIPSHGVQLVDAIVGNPPYVRAHRFKGEDREKALLAGNRYLKLFLGPEARLARGSNYWAPFLLHACSFLRPAGRIAIVLPTELLTADYAQPIREFLRKRFRNISFILFQKRIFEEEQDVLLMLADSLGEAGIFKNEVGSLKELSIATSKITSAPQLNNGYLIDRWTAILTNQRILDLLDSFISDDLVVQFQTIATVKIGIVTGYSKYFTLKPSEARIARLKSEWLKPILTKASHIRGSIFTENDLNELQRNDAKCLLLRIPPDTDIAKDSDLQQYIDWGRLEKIHTLFKCSTRWPWYSVPYSLTPDMFLTYMSGKRCRLCINQAEVNSTNNIHHIFLKDKKLKNAFAISFYSSLTGLSIELMGRGYGGGLLKLEPGDVKRLLLPNPKLLVKANKQRVNHILSEVDIELRSQQSRGIWKELDDLILVRMLGLSRAECNMLHEETQRLQKRRVSRS